MLGTLVESLRGAILGEDLLGQCVARVSCRSFLGREVLCFDYGFEIVREDVIELRFDDIFA